ncbi:MAG: protein translocase subunit SecD [Parcubacteria group bacterium]|nr:protein translocase subunit SecD [Parcubacteria group bacterium]
MLKNRIAALLIVLFGLGIGYFLYASETGGGVLSRFPFKLGLDLSGGTHLVYKADVSGIPAEEVDVSMDALRDVIERRVNLFGVTEPNVQTEETMGIISEGKEHRLVVELPGVTDVEQATDMIGRTPVLEFKLALPGSKEGEILFQNTGLTGRFVEGAQVAFHNVTSEPMVLLKFSGEGERLFAKITRENIGEVLAIFLDGSPISLPVIEEEISGGSAQITGQFTPEEAKQLVGRLNSGALPVPIELLTSQTIGATLGAETIEKGIRAGLFGLLGVVLFMMFWYRLPGFIAGLALVLYVFLNLTVFKLIGVTLTAAGIAGFVLSIGMAVDGNILIFERMKEELQSGKKLREAIRDGFDRAWAAIWDGNITALVSAIVLFWFGTSLIEGFALTFGIGILLSMLSSITVSRIFLYALAPEDPSKTVSTLFGSGVSK